MKNLSQLSNAELLTKTRTLVGEERRITLDLIEHLREIERRMVFAEMGFSSLFEFCVKHLGLSEGSAQRRISSMRLFRDLPEAKQSLISGELSLSNAAKLQSVFRAKKKQDKELNLSEKRKVLQQVSGLTQRECESKLFEILPETMTSLTEERERRIGENSTELRLVVDDEFYSKLQRLKELLPSQNSKGHKEVLEYLIDKEIEFIEKKKGLRKHSTAAAVQTEKVRSVTPRKKLPAPIQRAVWRRADGKCEYNNCTSRFHLEIDHRVPVAVGGSDELSNLQLLCRTHNVLRAKQSLGAAFMSRYVPMLKEN